jgi:hypothetical protein
MTGYGSSTGRLVDRTARRSPAPPSEQLDQEPPSGALTLEVRSMQDEVLHRRYLVDAIPQSIEAGVGDGTLRRVEHVPPVGGFSSVVPAPEKDSVVVVSAGPGVVLGQPDLADVGRPGQWRELLRDELEGS